MTTRCRRWPKLERYDNTLFLVLKTVNYVEHESVALAREIVETGEIMVFVGPDFVVTVRHGDHTGLAGVRKKMEDEHKQLQDKVLLHEVSGYAKAGTLTALMGSSGAG